MKELKEICTKTYETDYMVGTERILVDAVDTGKEESFWFYAEKSETKQFMFSLPIDEVTTQQERILFACNNVQEYANRLKKSRRRPWNSGIIKKNV